MVSSKSFDLCVADDSMRVRFFRRPKTNPLVVSLSAATFLPSDHFIADATRVPVVDDLLVCFSECSVFQKTKHLRVYALRSSSGKFISTMNSQVRDP